MHRLQCKVARFQMAVHVSDASFNPSTRHLQGSRECNLLEALNDALDKCDEKVSRPRCLPSGH